MKSRRHVCQWCWAAVDVYDSSVSVICWRTSLQLARCFEGSENLQPTWRHTAAVAAAPTPIRLYIHTDCICAVVRQLRTVQGRQGVRQRGLPRGCLHCGYFVKLQPANIFIDTLDI